MDIFPVIRFSFSLYKKILWIIFVPAIPSTIRNISEFLFRLLYSDFHDRNTRERNWFDISIGEQILFFKKKKERLRFQTQKKKREISDSMVN